MPPVDYRENSGEYQTVTPLKPLPVTFAGVAGLATAANQVIQINQGTALLADTATLVTQGAALATNLNAYVIALGGLLTTGNANTAALFKPGDSIGNTQFAIDQTTPGVSNGIIFPFSRSVQANIAFTPSSSTGYPIGQAIGPAGSAILALDFSAILGVKVSTVKLDLAFMTILLTSITSNGSFTFAVYSAAPSTTITSGTIPTYDLATTKAWQAGTSLTNVGPGSAAGSGNFVSYTNPSSQPVGQMFNTDGAGLLYIVITSNTAQVFVGWTDAQLTLQLRY